MSRIQSPFFKLAHAVLAGAAVVLICAGYARAASLRVTPDRAYSGQTVLLRVENVKFEHAYAIRVIVADQIAPVVRVVDSVTVEVMIPTLSPGEARVVLEYLRQKKGEAPVTIVPSPLRRVFLRLDGDSVIVDRTRPYSGEYDRNATSGRRLSYDVISERGRLLYTGTIPHPKTDTYEVFGSEGTSSPVRAPAPESLGFAIKIPYSPGTTVVKLYDVPAGADLSSDKGRAERRLIGQIEVRETP